MDSQGMAGMRKRRKKKRKPDVQNVAGYVESLATQVFADATAQDIPKFVMTFVIWGRVCIAAVISQDASELPLVGMDVIRKETQKTYRQPVALILYSDDQQWSWRRAEERVVQLLTEHGGEAS